MLLVVAIEELCFRILLLAAAFVVVDVKAYRP